MSPVTATLLLLLTVLRAVVCLTPTAVWVWAVVLPRVILLALLPAPAPALKLLGEDR